MRTRSHSSKNKFKPSTTFYAFTPHIHHPFTPHGWMARFRSVVAHQFPQRSDCNAYILAALCVVHSVRPLTNLLITCPGIFGPMQNHKP